MYFDRCQTTARGNRLAGVFSPKLQASLSSNYRNRNNAGDTVADYKAGYKIITVFKSSKRTGSIRITPTMNVQLCHVARDILNIVGGRERGVKSYKAALPPNRAPYTYGGYMWYIWPTDPDHSKGGGEGVNGPLCRQCQRIDWLKILKKCRIAKWESQKSDYRPEMDRVRPTKLRGLRVWDFKDETNRNCPLCNWFPPQRVSIEPLTTFQGGCSLHAFSGANFCQTIKESNPKVDVCSFEAYSGAEFYVFIILHDYELNFSMGKLSKVFSVVPDNDVAAKLGPPLPMFRWHREVRPQINTYLLKHWLQTCHQEHHRCSSMDPKSLASGLPYGLRVVDCVQEQVIPAPAHCEYVALSYVWGRREVFAFEQRPKTIRDAMSLTLSLGKRYLWVDKYCVEQAPQTEEEKEYKRRQLDAMGLTYECSFATIAAVEGLSEDHGLCGVGTPRHPQPSIVVGVVKLVKDWDERNRPYIVLDDFVADYSPRIETCWGTRAWTYQEALLSPRLLFLHGTEVYFECRSMSCRESDALVIKKEPLWCVQEGLAVVTHKKLITVGGSDKCKEVLHLFWKCAQEYNTRLLTFDSDAMIAFQGVLQRFATPPDDSALSPLPTVCGTPLLDIFSGSHLTLDPSSILLGISWYNQSSIRQVRRRRNQDGTYPLPSWTWLAWEATLVPPRALDFSDKYTPIASVSQESDTPLKCLRIRAPIHKPTILACGWPVRSFDMTPPNAPTETDGGKKHTRSIALLYTYAEVRVCNPKSYSDMVFVMLIKWLDEARTKAERIGGEPIHRRFFEHLTEEELLGNEREFLLY